MQNNNNVMLTTIDNPFDPFNDFAHWLEFDKRNGHNTCEWIARLSTDSDAMSDEEVVEEQLRIYNRIIELDLEGLYYLVYENDAKKLISLSKPYEK